MTSTEIPKTLTGRFFRTAKSYGLQIYCLLRDLLRSFSPDVMKVLFTAGASLLCQASALLVLYAYLRALEENTQLLGLATRESALLFVLVAIVTLLLLVGYSLLENRASVAILRLCRRYQYLGTQEAMVLCSALPHWFVHSAESHISARHLRQILSVDVHHRSRMARVLLLAIIPAARLVLCAIALLYTNPQFSVVILFAVGIPVLGLYSVGRRVADTITIRETSSPPVFLRQREMLEESWQRNSALDTASVNWEETLGRPDSRYRQYFRRLRAKALGDFLINSANTVGILVLVIALGVWILREQEGNWSLWLTYLLVLRYFLSSLRNFAQLLVRSTRFSRQAQRFTEFVTAARIAAGSLDPASIPCPQHLALAYKGSSDRRGDKDDADDDLDED